MPDNLDEYRYAWHLIGEVISGATSEPTVIHETLTDASGSIVDREDARAVAVEIVRIGDDGTEVRTYADLRAVDFGAP